MLLCDKIRAAGQVMCTLVNVRNGDRGRLLSTADVIEAYKTIVPAPRTSAPGHTAQSRLQWMHILSMAVLAATADSNKLQWMPSPPPPLPLVETVKSKLQ